MRAGIYFGSPRESPSDGCCDQGSLRLHLEIHRRPMRARRELLRAVPPRLARVSDVHDASSPVAQRAFTSARAILRALDVTRTCWTPPTESVCPWIFRGHADARWRLQPPTFRDTGEAAKIYREAERRVLVEDPRAQLLAAKGPAGSWDLRRYVQTRLVREFAILADRQGFELPGADPNVVWGRLTPDEEHPITAIAQHHRVPTPLLDFSRDPLVALQWATEPAPEGATHLAVWALDETQTFSPAAIRSYPQATNQNMRAQSGLFVRFTGVHDDIRDGRPLPSLDTCGAVKVGGLRCFTLPRTELLELRRLLELRGMHLARLLPTLDGVAQTVARRYSV